MKLHLVAALSIAVVCNIYSAYSQNGSVPAKDIRHSKLLWFDFSETIKFNKKWSLVTEYSPRFVIDPIEVSQNVIRSYGVYNLGENWSVGAGFAAFFNKTNDITVHELRPEQFLFYKQQFEKAKRLTILHRFRIEERFARKTSGGEITSGYNFAMRYRYRIGLEITLAKLGAKENPLKCFANEEIFLQTGELVLNIFEQNRILAGVSYRVVKGLTLAAGYMNIFRQTRTAGVYDKIHTFRFSIQHELNLTDRKKKKA